MGPSRKVAVWKTVHYLCLCARMLHFARWGVSGTPADAQTPTLSSPTHTPPSVHGLVFHQETSGEERGVTSDPSDSNTGSAVASTSDPTDSNAGSRVVSTPDPADSNTDSRVTSTPDPADSNTGSRVASTPDPADSNTGSRVTSTTDPADSNTGSRVTSTPDPADSNTGSRVACTPDPADSNTGSRVTSTPDPPDSNTGSRVTSSTDPADSNTGSRVTSTTDPADSNTGSRVASTTDATDSNNGSGVAPGDLYQQEDATRNSNETLESETAVKSVGSSTQSTTQEDIPMGNNSSPSPFVTAPTPGRGEEPMAYCTVAEYTLNNTEKFINVTKARDNGTEAQLQDTECRGTMRVPQGQFINAFFDRQERKPIPDCTVRVAFCRSTDCNVYMSPTVINDDMDTAFYQFEEDTVYIYVIAGWCETFSLQLHYRAVRFSRQHLPVVVTSSTSGYVTSPGYDDMKPYPPFLNATFRLNITQGEVVLVSFPHFSVEKHPVCRYDSLTLSVDSGKDLRWVKCGVRDLALQVFNTSIHLWFQSDNVVQSSGFKMMYTVLNSSQGPLILNNGLLNCSVAHFAEFAHHVNCNLAVECAGKEDEADCSYTTNACGPGLVDAGDKCYYYARVTENLTWYEAYSECLSLNKTLVSPRSPGEWEVFLRLMRHGSKTSTVYTGLRTSQASVAKVPALYRDMWQWSDQTMALYTHLEDVSHLPIPMCTKLLRDYRVDSLLTASCVHPDTARYVCEKEKSSANAARGDGLLLPSLGANSTWPKNVTVVPCPSGHVVRDFLSCDPQSQCREENQTSSCETLDGLPLFQCEYSSQTVHYTLVCDFNLDCSDGSDEYFCKRHKCPEYSCRSGECIASKDHCDGMQHCADASDENCPQVISKIPETVPPPVVVRFNGTGGYTLQAMQEPGACPQTHFRCANHSTHYCLPLYVRCNDVLDCPGGEDETACNLYECPGFYRCRGSRVCLHPDHVCDGVFQCPLRDDELLCDLVCPDACRCQGLAFVCRRPFRASSFPSLRYLDASGSNMALDDLDSNFYLIHLRLARCQLKTIPRKSFGNLRTLDLSDNSLSVVKLKFFLSMKNLRVLILAGNPLVKVVPDAASQPVHTRLKSLDFSRTHIATFNGTTFANFCNLKELNLSNSALTCVTPEGFGTTPDLEVLDLRGTTLETYPIDMLKALSSLREVFADDFKLCCQATLPDDFDTDRCHAPSDDIASCEDLLRLDVYRVFLWAFALLAVVGNAGSFVARFYLQSESFQSSFNVLVTNLSVADFLMGVYLAVIGVADLVYRGQYLWHGETWKESVACRSAGFLSLLSTEVSAFLICLITLDRFLVLRFPFSKIHFRKRSALVACGIAWLVGFALAVVPLLPVTSHWQFYSQTGICIPLPFTSKETFRGHSYSFSVLIVLNLVLFLLIAVGQVFIYGAVRANSMAQVKKKASRDAAIARRLTTIVLSDFLCWFPIGLLGLLAFTGTSIPADVNVGVAIFVLPFNSALNPFLYTFNLLAEKRRKATEARLLQRLESRHLTELSRLDARLPSQLPVTKETALNQIEGWLGVRVLTLSDLAARFHVMPRMDDTESPSQTAATNDVL